MAELNYRDDDTLSSIIANVYSDGSSDGESWSSNAWYTDDRDYAMRRADALEALEAQRDA